MLHGIAKMKIIAVGFSMMVKYAKITSLGGFGGFMQKLVEIETLGGRKVEDSCLKYAFGLFPFSLISSRRPPILEPLLIVGPVSRLKASTRSTEKPLQNRR